MNFIDRDLKCVNCGVEFVFTAGEQEFFRARGFTNTPKSCRECRSKKNHRPMRADSKVTCADCGSATTVPFTPRQHRPVYCRACFSEHRSEVESPVCTTI
ncbi:zinc-ribbon domain containing protein [Occallatibacter savannae]|uniref:zinc-ribbon domain containing protein n=1 Tax=Occallatibacter savannae TaxID=1002691 RepID=UPI000D695639|nr:zinc-ribbon domain containing protein [Occallatibacter savannae]